MNRRTCALIALPLCFALAGLAADKPDFSGNWKLNPSKSDLGQMPVPDKYEMKVEHKEPVLKSTTVSVGQMGERTMEATYKTDGTESINKGFGNSETKSTPSGTAACWRSPRRPSSRATRWRSSPMESRRRWQDSDRRTDNEERPRRVHHQARPRQAVARSCTREVIDDSQDSGPHGPHDIFGLRRSGSRQA